MQEFIRKRIAFQKKKKGESQKEKKATNHCNMTGLNPMRKGRIITVLLRDPL